MNLTPNRRIYWATYWQVNYWDAARTIGPRTFSANAQEHSA